MYLCENAIMTPIALWLTLNRNTARVMDQQEKALTALVEDLSLIPGMCVGWLTTICDSWESDGLLDLGCLATESTLRLPELSCAE